MAETFSVEKVKEMLSDIIKPCFEKAQEQQKAEGYIKLERGFATILLPGLMYPSALGTFRLGFCLSMLVCHLLLP